MASTIGHLVEQCDDWEEKISEDNLSKLTSLLVEGSTGGSSVAKEDVVRGVQLVADLARADDNRTALSAPAILTSVAALYKHYVRASIGEVTHDTIPNGVLQCTRATGNLCYFNSGNRAIFASEGTVPVVSEVLVAAATHGNATLVRVAAGVVANLAFENDDVQDVLSQSPDIHKIIFGAFFDCDGDEDIDTVTRAVTNIVQAPRQWPTLSSGGFFDRIATIIQLGSSPLRLRIATILTTAFNDASKDELAAVIPTLVLNHNFVQSIIAAVASPTVEEVAVEAVELAKQNELPSYATRPPLQRQVVGLLLSKLAESESPDVQAVFVSQWPRLLSLIPSDDIIAFRCAALCLGYLGFHSGEVRQLIFDNLPHFVAALAGQRLPKGDTDVQMGLTMLLAVTIEGPERVQAIVDNNAHTVLLEFLDQQYDPRVVHQALGALRNLSIPAVQKPVLVQCGAVPLITEVLNFSRDVTILYSAVVALRSLLAYREPAHLAAIVDGTAVVPTLVSLWERHWEAGTERVLWEAARALSIVIRDGRGDVCRTHNAVDKPLATLICSAYAPLRQEGWAAVVALAESAAVDSDPLVAVLNAIDNDLQPSLEEIGAFGEQALLLLLKAVTSDDCTFTLRQLNLAKAGLTDTVVPAIRAFLQTPKGASIVQTNVTGNEFSDANLSFFSSL